MPNIKMTDSSGTSRLFQNIDVVKFYDENSVEHNYYYSKGQQMQITAKYHIYFLDYDGKIVYSIPIAEGQTTSDWPTITPPARTGWTFNGWSIALADIPQPITNDFYVMSLYVPNIADQEEYNEHNPVVYETAPFEQTLSTAEPDLEDNGNTHYVILNKSLISTNGDFMGDSNKQIAITSLTYRVLKQNTLCCGNQIGHQMYINITTPSNATVSLVYANKNWHNMYVDWGDGSIIDYPWTGQWGYYHTTYTHVYAEAGTYNVQIFPYNNTQLDGKWWVDNNSFIYPNTYINWLIAGDDTSTLPDVYGSTTITSYTITNPNGIKSVLAKSFNSTTNLHHIINANGVVPIFNNMEFVANEGFRSSAIEEFYAPNLKILGTYAFCDNYFLKEITAPLIGTIGEYTFSSCYSLPTFIGTKYTSIGNYAFQFTRHLLTMTIPNTCTAIGAYTFFGSGFNTLVVGSGAPTFGDYCFSGSLLRQVTLNSSGNWGHQVFLSCHKLIGFTIPEGPTSIGNNSFRDCQSLQNVHLADSITSLGSTILYNDYNLQSVYFGNGLTTIPNQTCEHCHSLESIHLPSALEVIGASAFHNTSLSSLSFPSTLLTIGDNAFYSESAVAAPTFTQLSIPDSVITIGSNAFRYIGSIKEIVIGENDSTVETTLTIGGTAFYGMYGLEEVTLQRPNISIGNECFRTDRALLYLNFANASNLTLGNHVFRDCTSLQTIAFGPEPTSWGTGTFANDKSLQNVTIPEGYTSLPAETFYQCYGLKTISLPSTMQILDIHCLRQCHNIDTLVLPASITTINEYALRQDQNDYINGTGPTYLYYAATGIRYPESGFLDLYSYAITPPTMAANQWPRIPVRLHVPAGSLNDYKGATNWSTAASAMIGDL